VNDPLDAASQCPAFPMIRSWPTGGAGGPLAPPGRHHEWLLTTGHGGFAMGTPESRPRRKYHALLIGTRNPPVERVALLNEAQIGLCAHDGGDAIRWCSPETLRRFERHPDSVVWTHELAGSEVRVQLRLARHRSVCRLDITASKPSTLALKPWLTLRDFHEVLRPAEEADLSARRDSDLVIVQRASGLACWLGAPGARFEAGAVWSAEQHYDLETARGLPDRERWFSPGVFVIDAAPGRPATLHAGLGTEAVPLEDRACEDESRRLRRLVRDAAACTPALERCPALVLAADQFIIERRVDGRPLASVIAGYPWFADWGRDTMIALPGLLLCTGRHAEALGCLQTFARHESEGMIPNRFDDDGGPPHYNTVDASLWFVHACRAYALGSGDLDTVRWALLPACRAIVAGYQSGTRFGIVADPDDLLIAAGDATTQLTWMDAKRDGVAFTPRHGKAVEINALWHHALHCLAELTDDVREAQTLRALAARVRASFIAAFWDEQRQRLRDCLRRDADGRWLDTDELRPNQIIAASLAFGPLDDAQRRAVVACVREHLLTPVGLRTLAAGQRGYRSHFVGDMISRDGAYHNGTVWPWLIGAYAEAVLRAGHFSDAAQREALAAIAPLLGSMDTGCLGSIAEVYDAEPEPGSGRSPSDPLARRHEGCLAQAWSVAEPLRVLALLARSRDQA
jgi:predicted glycogen debranching enzyme